MVSEALSDESVLYYYLLNELTNEAELEDLDLKKLRLFLLDESVCAATASAFNQCAFCALNQNNHFIWIWSKTMQKKLNSNSKQ